MGNDPELRVSTSSHETPSPPVAGPPPERVQLWGEYYIRASSLSTRSRKRVLNHGKIFGIFDVTGDLPPRSEGGFGLFSEGARHLSSWELCVAGQHPLFLNSAVTDDSCQLVVNLTNGAIEDGSADPIPGDTVYIERSLTIVDDVFHEQIRLRNYHAEEVRLAVELRFAADFADVFEVRGWKRQQPGRYLDPHHGEDEVTLAYEGADGVVRETIIRPLAPACVLTGQNAIFDVHLDPQEQALIEVAVVCRCDGSPMPTARSYREASRCLHRERQGWVASTAQIHSSNSAFNSLLDRTLVDVAMLLDVGPDGPFPYAGIPWFAAIFGRDSLITAWEMLLVAPDVARATLRTLARFQGGEMNTERDEEPGKIVHEMRTGELAATGEIPFRRYYGSIDATPLFLVVLGAYVRRTGDLDLARELWPNVEAAMHWIDEYGDLDGDGYVEYRRASTHGLVNQGWKDSCDAVFHADGRLASPPIALAEVQAYVYAARIHMAILAQNLGFDEQAKRWRAQAQRLRASFQRDFWSERLGAVVLALDGDKRPCEVLTSNAGQCLMTGILNRSQAAKLSTRLLKPDMFSGWGIRTVSSDAPRFNPLSYHNGSVWPHDNALIALGLRRAGRLAGTLKVLTGMFDASVCFDGAPLPELFCGFDRIARVGPVSYPVACRPQAWAAASTFMLLRAILGLEFEGLERRLIFERPQLPSWLDWLEITNLRVGSGRVDLTFHRGRRGASLEVTRKDGDLELIVLPR